MKTIIEHKSKTGWHTFKMNREWKWTQKNLLTLDIVKQSLAKRSEYRFFVDGGAQHQYRIVVESDRAADENFFRNCNI